MSEKKLALVTGASRGIGFAIAERLVADGYRVVGTATSESGAEALQAKLRVHGDEHSAAVLNIADSEQTNAAMKSLLSEYGTPLVVVNNAGITRDNLFLRLSEDDWDAVVNTNLSGVFRVCKALAKAMLKQKAGSIINISSIIGTTGNGGQANYAAAKAGLEGFSRSLAQEIASRNITVNCVAPGFIQTDMTDVLPETQKEAILASIPGKRFGHVDDIAGAVAFLASDDARYITGQTIHVNGGMNMG
ncbi:MULTISPECIES: 3-oxoacyl-ACP reductase FabG [unclassified Thalassolituus]|jgi:3-oxoacyl-[acyl-carrier protein] reductase|uniref:3-oxoacyl-ACP reductase FabG n=1 Tax=unclassified Thalassolituus TaxID=2624967 RepID=UPI000C0E27E7|nr:MULTISPECIES: 3-oxoacyl-ACP reductase FabG [unclassified Thalassolituus]MBN57949.1 3-oxoacyl-ACP reductase [Oceanospirillaceae bacterium]MDQ4425240.1 3-oxoacyl-ACP reductase FabG [Thalassolituus sp.]|tara:strand:- start:2638 stop:3378 length:741 start_codon:yes stop_codon:yes gene_type:complete